MAILSVIVPIYNVEKYLDRCITSIINQSLKDIEILLINDGSTDNSLAICEKYCDKDKRIKLINKKNEGVSSARNLGIKMANGKYIAFVDSDDFINNTMLENLINIAEKESSDIVTCNYEEFKDEISIEKNKDVMVEVKNYSNLEALEDYFAEKKQCEKVFHTMVWNKIYRRILFNDIKFPCGKLYEDGYVTYKLLYNASKITAVNISYYYYFKRPGSIMNSGFKKEELNSYDDWREIFYFIKENCDKLSSNVAKGYIYKHLTTYKQVINNKEILGSKYYDYKTKIKSDLMEDLIEILKLKIGINNKIKLILFLYFNINLI